MKIILVIFSGDLDKEVIEKIKGISGNWSRITSTSWCIKTDRDIAEIRNQISLKMSNKNRLFVVDITNSAWESYCLHKEVSHWLKN